MLGFVSCKHLGTCFKSHRVCVEVVVGGGGMETFQFIIITQRKETLVGHNREKLF